MTPSPHDAPQATHPATRCALAMLDQCAAMLTDLPDACYTAPSNRMLGSTIGQHVRHALDHFSATLAGADGAVIDNDHRERDTPLERSRTAALDTIAAITAALAGLDHADADRAVSVRVMLSADGAEAELRSTLARELAFAAHHAVHHHAMVASIALERGAALPPGFGKAPSTLHHERADRP